MGQDSDATAMRRRLSSEERRAQLIAVGRAEVERTSFESLSTDDVAEAAGISRSLLFHYFPTREDFLLALAADAADELLAITDPEPGLPPRERLRAALEAYVVHVTEHRRTYLSLVRGAAGGGAEMQAVFDRTRGELAARILDGLGAPAGTAPDTLRLMARGYVALAEELTVSWLRDPQLPRQAFLELLEGAAVALVSVVGVTLDAGA